MSGYRNLIAQLPRVGLNDLKPDTKIRVVRHKFLRGRGRERVNIKPRIGFAFGNVSFQKKIPQTDWNKKNHLKRQYYPLTLWQLQHMIDLGRIDPTKPIDLNTILHSRVFQMPFENTYYGIYLLSQGSNIFKAEVNIEVQVADDLAIASVEKQGGVLQTAYYDKISFQHLVDPISVFMKGKPIKKRHLPPLDLFEYYTDPKKRGYLSDPEETQKQRHQFAATYGYTLPDISQSENYEMLLERKDPRQIYFGLQPGSLVNLFDRCVIKPNEEYLAEHYKK